MKKYYLHITTFVDVEVEAESAEEAVEKGIMEALHTELDNDNWLVERIVDITEEKKSE